MKLGLVAILPAVCTLGWSGAAPSLAQQIIEAGQTGCPEREIVELQKTVVLIIDDTGETVERLAGPARLATPIPILKCVGLNMFGVVWKRKLAFVYRTEVVADARFKFDCTDLSVTSEGKVTIGAPSIIDCRKVDHAAQ